MLGSFNSNISWAGSQFLQIPRYLYRRGTDNAQRVTLGNLHCPKPEMELQIQYSQIYFSFIQITILVVFSSFIQTTSANRSLTLFFVQIVYKP